MDGLRDALAGDHHDHGRESTMPPVLAAHGRHADREAPAERLEDATLVTGGKHRA